MGYGVNGLHGIHALVIAVAVYYIDCTLCWQLPGRGDGATVVSIVSNLWAISSVLVNHLECNLRVLPPIYPGGRKMHFTKPGDVKLHNQMDVELSEKSDTLKGGPNSKSDQNNRLSTIRCTIHVALEVKIILSYTEPVFVKTAGQQTEQGRNFKGPTACSLLSDRMSDKNIPSMLLLIEFVHNPIAIQYKSNVKTIFHML